MMKHFVPLFIGLGKRCYSAFYFSDRFKQNWQPYPDNLMKKREAVRFQLNDPYLRSLWYLSSYEHLKGLLEAFLNWNSFTALLLIRDVIIPNLQFSRSVSLALKKLPAASHLWKHNEMLHEIKGYHTHLVQFFSVLNSSKSILTKTPCEILGSWGERSFGACLEKIWSVSNLSSKFTLRCFSA